jgi:hypothetical protein
MRISVHQPARRPLVLRQRCRNGYCRLRKRLVSALSTRPAGNGWLISVQLGDRPVLRRQPAIPSMVLRPDQAGRISLGQGGHVDNSEDVPLVGDPSTRWHGVHLWQQPECGLWGFLISRVWPAISTDLGRCEQDYRTDLQILYSIPSGDLPPRLCGPRQTQPLGHANYPVV